jgi:YidC/Oxa1 family membrane protein insertase
MDRNTGIGFALILLLLVAWSVLTAPDPKSAPKTQPKPAASAPAEQAAIADTLKQTEGTPAKLDTTSEGSRLQQALGAFAVCGKGENRAIRVRTGELDLVLNTQGASLKPLHLDRFKTSDSMPLPQIPEAAGSYYTEEFSHNRQNIDTRLLYFRTEAPADITVKKGEKRTITLRAEVTPTQYIEKSYTFHGDGFHVEQQVRFVGMQNLINDNQYYIHARLEVPRTEKSTDKMFPMMNIYYNYQDDVVSLDATAKEPEEKIEQGSVKWVAFKSQFFTNALIANTNFDYVKLNLSPGGKNKAVKTYEAYMQVPFTHKEVDTAGFRLYFGPNDYYVLNKYDLRLEKLLDLGWGPIKYVNAYVILPVFKLLENVTPNYGIIIFILALLIKLVTLPLTWRSHLSMAKMQVVNKMPELKALEEKYKDDPTKLQSEKMSFYSTVGVNPLGGCLPLLLQLPILLAMFSFFPASIELRQKAFLWANDLSTYDSIWDFGQLPIINSIYGDHVSLFTLLMTISTLVYTYISQQSQSASTPAQFKYLGYIMPLVFLGILNNYSAGLSYYYLVANLLTIVQTILMRAFVNEDKIHEQIHAKRKEKSKKGAPKGRLQRWMDEQQKKQQQMLKERNQKR